MIEFIDDIYDKHFNVINGILQTFLPDEWKTIFSISDEEIFEYKDQLINLINDIPIYDASYIGMYNPKIDTSIEEHVYIISYENHYYLVDREESEHAIYSVDITKFEYIRYIDRKNKINNLLSS
jgi:hypothetical protein